MKHFKIVIESDSKEDASVFATAIAGIVRKLGVLPFFDNVDLNTVSRLIGDDWTLGQELGKLAKPDENGIAGFGVTIEVK